MRNSTAAPFSVSTAASAFEPSRTDQAPQRVLQLQGETFEAQDRRSDAETAYQAALHVQPDLLDALLPLAKLKRIRPACEEASRCTNVRRRR